MSARPATEDWRLTVTLPEEGHAGRLLSRLHAHTVERQARERFGERIAVSGEHNQVFLYASSEEAAREARGIISELLTADGIAGLYQLERWHHEEERWEDAAQPLPGTAAEHAAEHERLEEEEAYDSRASGNAEWEVRVELASHDDAETLAAQLEREGWTHLVRRSSYLLAGAADEDDANALAERLKSELPAGATVHVEPGSGLTWQLMPGNPFAVFGGLAG